MPSHSVTSGRSHRSTASSKYDVLTPASPVYNADATSPTASLTYHPARAESEARGSNKSRHSKPSKGEKIESEYQKLDTRSTAHSKNSKRYDGNSGRSTRTSHRDSKPAGHPCDSNLITKGDEYGSRIDPSYRATTSSSRNDYGGNDYLGSTYSTSNYGGGKYGDEGVSMVDINMPAGTKIQIAEFSGGKKNNRDDAYLDKSSFRAGWYAGKRDYKKYGGDSYGGYPTSKVNDSDIHCIMALEKYEGKSYGKADAGDGSPTFEEIMAGLSMYEDVGRSKDLSRKKGNDWADAYTSRRRK